MIMESKPQSHQQNDMKSSDCRKTIPYHNLTCVGPTFAEPILCKNMQSSLFSLQLRGNQRAIQEKEGNDTYLEAVAIPRAIGSNKPSLSSIVCTKLAPTRPVSTTTAAVRDGLAPKAKRRKFREIRNVCIIIKY